MVHIKAQETSCVNLFGDTWELLGISLDHVLHMFSGVLSFREIYFSSDCTQIYLSSLGKLVICKFGLCLTSPSQTWLGTIHLSWTHDQLICNITMFYNPTPTAYSKVFH